MMQRVAIRALLYGVWLDRPLGGYMSTYDDHYCEYLPDSYFRVDNTVRIEIFTTRLAMFVFDRLFEHYHSHEEHAVSPFGYSPEYCIHGRTSKHRDCWFDQQESAYFMPFYVAVETGETLVSGDRIIGCMDFYVDMSGDRVQRVNHQSFLPSDHVMLEEIKHRFARERQLDPLKWGLESANSAPREGVASQN